MTDFYYVADSAQGTDPLPAPDYSAGSEVAGPYIGGRQYTLPSGFTTTASHNPSISLYTYVPATNPAPGDPRYYRPVDTLHYRDNADPALIVVEQVRAWEQIPIDELYREKEAQLSNHRNLVRLSACAISGQANWALILSQEARDTMLSVDRFFLDRTGDAVYDSIIDQGKVAADFPAYKTILSGIVSRWPGTRQVNVAIRHKTLGTQKLSPVSNAQEWGALAKDSGLFDIDISEAVYACSEDIDAAYDANGQGGWDALAAIDVTSATYGWPEYWPET